MSYSLHTVPVPTCLSSASTLTVDVRCLLHCLQIWIRPGGGLAEDYLQLIESFTANNTEATMIALLAVFALFHSGLAGLRPKGGCNRQRQRQRGLVSVLPTVDCSRGHSHHSSCAHHVCHHASAMWLNC